MRTPRPNIFRTPIPQPVAQPARRSVSRQMYDRFQHRKIWRRSIAITYIVVMTVYLAWRYTIINPHSLFLSIIYFAADCIGYVVNTVGVLASWRYNHRDPLPVPKGLTVDILLPTYKEPLHIIRRTAMAAKAIDYPHDTFILDDGRRDEVKAMADELGIRYLRRPQNLHAKAGNLNFGLAHSNAEFIMVFDADHIALPHGLDVLLGFFADKNVAMAQTPQEYYNIDAFQYFNSRNGALCHDQSAFYNAVEPCGDSNNAASCVGTGVVYRRSALDSIGGFPVETVTEDIHTSLRLHKAGFKCVFINEPIAYGIAAADLDDYYKTRHRWAHGNMHAMVLENLLFCKGLTLKQRIQYLALNVTYFEGWQQLLLFLVPVLSLALGWQPFKMNIFNCFTVLLFPPLSYLLLQEMGCGFTRYWVNEIFSMARWPMHIIAIAGLFGKKMIFRSSAKNIEGKVQWRLMLPQITVVVTSLLAVAVGFFRLHHNYTPGPLAQFLIDIVKQRQLPDANVFAPLPDGYTIDLMVVAGFWALYSVVRGLFFVHKTIKDARNSHSYFRFKVPLPVIFGSKGGGYGCVSSISEEWVSITDYRDGPHEIPGGTMNVTIRMPAGPLPVKVAVEQVGGREISGKLVFDSIEHQDRLANGLYSVDWHREFLHHLAHFLTPSDFILKCFGVKSPSHKDQGPWHATLFTAGGVEDQTYGVMAKFKNYPEAASLLTFREFKVGDELTGITFVDKKVSPFRCLVTGFEPLSSLTKKGLDGAAPARYRVSIVA